MAEEILEDIACLPAQTAHRLQMNAAGFEALSLAIHNLSVRELELCSPRRLLTSVLEDARRPLFLIPNNDLDRICNLGSLAGQITVNIRVDSKVNDRLREFRDYAEQQLGRHVSVLEAVHACAYALSGAA